MVVWNLLHFFKSVKNNQLRIKYPLLFRSLTFRLGHWHRQDNHKIKYVSTYLHIFLCNRCFGQLLILSVVYQQFPNSTELEDRADDAGTSGTPSHSCKPTRTVVRGGTACAGQTIFEDNFDSLRENIWQIEQYIPILNPVRSLKYTDLSLSHKYSDFWRTLFHDSMQIIVSDRKSIGNPTGNPRLKSRLIVGSYC